MLFCMFSMGRFQNDCSVAKNTGVNLLSIVWVSLMLRWDEMLRGLHESRVEGPKRKVKKQGLRMCVIFVYSRQRRSGFGSGLVKSGVAGLGFKIVYWTLRKKYRRSCQNASSKGQVPIITPSSMVLQNPVLT